MLWKQKNLTPTLQYHDNQNHRIFKSVLYIMFFVVGTWLFNTIYFTFISFMFTDTFSTQYIAPSINFLTCVIASSSNVFILFACSSKYRNAFKRLAFDLPILGKLIKGESGGANNVILVKPSIHLKPTFLRNEVYPKN
uniref:7TM GPCR serpentine receptor class x (Srx) domain-containing protein n=1 Tax=Meloidogyne incognita TaxID=6306 RepID=A0A914N042_MELIC